MANLFPVRDEVENELKNKEKDVVFVESSSSGEFGSDTPSPITGSQTTVPQRTSDWTENYLKSLNINIIQSKAFSPLSIITDVFNFSDPMVEERAYKIKEHICNNMPMGLSQLRFSGIEDVGPGLSSADASQWKIPPFFDSSTEPLFQKFRTQGEKFARYLNYLAILNHKGQAITEMMYQNLFQCFIEMFGLFCYPGPAVEKHKLVIDSEEVESIADLLILKSDNFKDIQIIAVCEVEKHYSGGLYGPSPAKTRCLVERPKKAIHHLSERLIGQSGGGLLLHFKSSASKKGILGLIIQKTYITFTRSCMEKDDIDVIAMGNAFSVDSGPNIKYSRPYNYIDIKDCKELIEPLLMLAFIQSKDGSSHL